MLYLPFHSCYAVISLQHAVGTIIIWLVIGGFACLEDKWVDVVRLHNICDPIIKLAVMAVKEEDLGFHLAISTGPTEETHCLHSAIPVDISLRRTVL